MNQKLNLNPIDYYTNGILFLVTVDKKSEKYEGFVKLISSIFEIDEERIKADIRKFKNELKAQNISYDKMTDS